MPPFLRYSPFHSPFEPRDSKLEHSQELLCFRFVFHRGSCLHIDLSALYQQHYSTQIIFCSLAGSCCDLIAYCWALSDRIYCGRKIELRLPTAKVSPRLRAAQKNSSYIALLKKGHAPTSRCTSRTRSG